jgi:hypothetical protein
VRRLEEKPRARVVAISVGIRIRPCAHAGEPPQAASDERGAEDEPAKTSSRDRRRGTRRDVWSSEPLEQDPVS